MANNRISADVLLDKALNETGLSEFGNDGYIGDYRRAVDAINEEVALTPTGLAIMEEWLVRTLVNVLRMQRDLKLHPEILDEALAPPLVISGFARTGTTKLQRLISVSPATQSLQLWKLLNPAPFDATSPDMPSNGPDPRIAFAEQASEMGRQAFPEMWAAHPSPPMDAEEDFLLHDMTFIAPTDGMRCGAAQWMEKWTPMDIRVYEFLRTVLKYLQWQDRKANRGTNHSARPWVLKSPIHIGNAATLLKVFPGAKFVFCHRNVEVAMASLCSLQELSRGMISDNLDLAVLGNEVLTYWSGEWRRNVAQRALLDPSTFCDIRFDDINRDGMAVAERVHAFAGLPFDAAARRACADWEAANPRHQGGKHEYLLETYGLTREQVRETFAFYYDHFAGSGVVG